MVYFIAAGDDAIKTGFTEWNVWERVANLQGQHYRELRLLGVIEEGDHRLELLLHARFSDERIRREWFRPSARLVEFIEREANPPERLQTPWRMTQEWKHEREQRAHAKALELQLVGP